MRLLSEYFWVGVCLSRGVVLSRAVDFCDLLRLSPLTRRFVSPSVLWHCWLGGRKGIRPVKKMSGGVLVWLSVWSEVQTCIWPSWCHCHSLSLASVKSRLVSPFWYRLTRVVPDKGPLNVCVCVCVCSACYAGSANKHSESSWRLFECVTVSGRNAASAIVEADRVILWLQSTDAQHSATQQHGFQPERWQWNWRVETVADDETTCSQVSYATVCGHASLIVAWISADWP